MILTTSRKNRTIRIPLPLLLIPLIMFRLRPIILPHNRIINMLRRISTNLMFPTQFNHSISQVLVCGLFIDLVELAYTFEIAVAEVVAGAGGFPGYGGAVLGFWVVVRGGRASVRTPFKAGRSGLGGKCVFPLD
jgi:hypothetical protein